MPDLRRIVCAKNATIENAAFHQLNGIYDAVRLLTNMLDLETEVKKGSQPLRDF